jgi:hypothetical protein
MIPGDLEVDRGNTADPLEKNGFRNGTKGRREGKRYRLRGLRGSMGRTPGCLDTQACLANTRLYQTL